MRDERTANSTTQGLKKALANLKVMCPTKYPVYVRRTKLPDPVFGDAEFTKVKGKPAFKIRLCSTLPFQFQMWVLIHEWAHCMTWDITHDKHGDHGAHFGVAYSEAYKAIYE